MGLTHGQTSGYILTPVLVDADGTVHVTGSLTSFPHVLLDGSVHSDTQAHTPVRGDIIRASSAPLWQALALGASGTILSSDGSDAAYQTLKALFNQGLAGTAFPASPAAGDVFFRTDLGWLCYYDGTRWLTVHEYAEQLLPVVYSATGASARHLVRSDYAIYVTRVSAVTRVATTNDGANYWSVSARGGDLALATFTTLYTFNTSADAPDTYTDHSGAPTTAAPTNRIWLDMLHTKVLAPGNLTGAGNIYYRLIVT